MLHCGKLKFLFFSIVAQALLLSTFLPAAPESAATDNASSSNQSDKIVIVLDASGSMWGQIKNQAKINIAKSVVKDLVSDLDQGVDLGLTAYGHRKKGDCEDIEALVPVSPVDKAQFTSVVNEISPKGKTPLSKAVIQAAEELKYTEQKATVILVSEGIETCDYDPCEVATKLEEAGIDFTTHVVGFDINDEEAKRQLTCLAENTGGKFLAASDAATLKSSLDEAVKEVVKSKNVQLVAVNEPGGDPLSDVYFEVYEPKTSDLDKPKRVTLGGGSQPKYTLSPGEYLVKVRSTRGKANAEKTITVPEGKALKEEVILAEEGVVQLVAVNEEGGEPLDKDLYWNVYEYIEGDDTTQEPKRVNYGGGPQPEYKLLPGKYLAKVKSTRGKAEAEKVITVTAGKQTKEEVLLAKEGLIKLVAVTKPGGEPLDAMYWNVYEAQEADSIEKPVRVSYGGGNTPEYKLLPGRYLAKVKSTKGKATAEQEIEVTAGKRETVEVVIDEEGEIHLLAVNEAGGKPLSDITWSIYTIVPEDSLEDPKQVSYGKGDTPTYRLLPGKYLAKAKSRRGKAKVKQEVEVIGGKKTKAEVLFPVEGELELFALEKEGGKPLNSGVQWQLLTKVAEDSLQTPEVVHYGGGAKPRYRALPGKYTVKLRVPKHKLELEEDVEVVAGKRTKHEIVITSEG